jgi:hypothetical protein
MPDLITDYRELEEQCRWLGSQTEHDELRLEYMGKVEHYRALAEREERRAKELRGRNPR